MTDRHFEDEQPIGLSAINGFSGSRRLAVWSHEPPRAGPAPGSGSPVPDRATSDGALQQSARPLYQATIVHVCLMLLAVANITSGILIADQEYERLPAPLLLSVLLSLICGWLQSADRR